MMLKLRTASILTFLDYCDKQAIRHLSFLFYYLTHRLLKSFILSSLSNYNFKFCWSFCSTEVVFAERH